MADVPHHRLQLPIVEEAQERSQLTATSVRFFTQQLLFANQLRLFWLACILFWQFQTFEKQRVMKEILAVGAIAALYSCSPSRELQVKMVSAELVRIDTAFRYNNPKQMLTWRDDNNVDYIIYAPMKNVFLLGSKMMVLVKR